MKEGGEKVYTGQGCTDKITFHERKVHEAQCPWSIVPCPNSEECGTLLARDVTEHLVECKHATCENVKYGCDYRGTSGEVEKHEEDCKFMVVRGVIESFRLGFITFYCVLLCTFISDFRKMSRKLAYQ